MNDLSQRNLEAIVRTKVNEHKNRLLGVGFFVQGHFNPLVIPKEEGLRSTKIRWEMRRKKKLREKEEGGVKKGKKEYLHILAQINFK